jgi:hypothetical protein
MVDVSEPSQACHCTETPMQKEHAPDLLLTHNGEDYEV